MAHLLALLHRSSGARADVRWLVLLAAICGLGLLRPEGDPVRAASGLVFALLLPGWAFLIAVGNRWLDLSPLERAGLAPILSLAILVLVSLGLNETEFGLRDMALIGALTAWCAAGCALALVFARDATPPTSMPGLLVVAGALAVAALIVHLPSSPHLGNPTREPSLALTTPAGEIPGRANGVAGGSFRVVAEIRAGTEEPSPYRLLARFGQEVIADEVLPELNPGEFWARELAVPLTQQGTGQPLVVELYRLEDDRPLRTTTLAIDVG